MPPTFAAPRFLGALFLSDYWGRPTQTAIEAFVSNRGWYAGRDHADARRGRRWRCGPTVTRVGVAVLALLTTLFVLGQPPVADLMVLLPGFETAHNGRMVIFVLFAPRSAGRVGPRRAQQPRASAGLPAGAVALAAAAAIFCVPFAWLLVAGTIDLGALRPALKVAWLFDEPPGGIGARCERPWPRRSCG